MVPPIGKHALDLCVAGLALVALSPLLAAIAVLVRLDSPGPVLFRQRRLGLDMQPFTVLKFRTMQADADPEPHREFLALLAREDPETAGPGGL